jgi:hypothetical protein
MNYTAQVRLSFGLKFLISLIFFLFVVFAVISSFSKPELVPLLIRLASYLTSIASIFFLRYFIRYYNNLNHAIPVTIDSNPELFSLYNQCAEVVGISKLPKLLIASKYPINSVFHISPRHQNSILLSRYFIEKLKDDEDALQFILMRELYFNKHYFTLQNHFLKLSMLLPLFYFYYIRASELYCDMQASKKVENGSYISMCILAGIDSDQTNNEIIEFLESEQTLAMKLGILFSQTPSLIQRFKAISHSL